MAEKAGVKKRGPAKKPAKKLAVKTVKKKPSRPRKVKAKIAEEAIEVVESHHIPTAASCSPEPTLEPALQPTLEPLRELAAESVSVTEPLSETVSESAPKSSPAPASEPMRAAEPSPEPDAASTNANATETALIVRPSEAALAARKSQYQSFAQPLALVNGNIAPGSFPPPPATMPVKGDLRHDSFIAYMSNEFQKQQDAFEHLNTKPVENTTSAPKFLAQPASFAPQQSMPSSASNAASLRPALDKIHAFGASSMPSHSSGATSASFPSSTGSHFQFTTTKTFSSQSLSGPLFGTSTQPSIAEFATPAFTIPRSAQVNKRRARPTVAPAPPMPSIADAKDELLEEPEELPPDGSEYYELKHDVLKKASALYNKLPHSMQDRIATRKALTAPEQTLPQSPPEQTLPYTPEQAAEIERIYYESLMDPLDDDADFETKNQRACATLNTLWPDNCTRFDVDREYAALKLLIHPDVNKHSEATEAMNRVNAAYALLDQYFNAEAQKNPEEKRGRYAQIGEF
jgi:hypothetical protein